MTSTDPAAALQLRDIHLPPDPSWWPPAPGWWLLAALLIGVLAFALIRGRHAVRRRRERRALDRQLQQIRQQHPPDREPTAALGAASELLRRACRKYAPAALTLTGEAWLEFLDAGLADRPFSTGPGRRLLDGPFRPHVDAGEAQAALDAVARRLPKLVGGR